MLSSVSRGFVDRSLGRDNNTIHEITLNITNSLFDEAGVETRVHSFFISIDGYGERGEGEKTSFGRGQSFQHW